MHVRLTPFVNPDRAPYALVAVPDRSDHLVKIPSVAKALKLAREIDSNIVATVVGLSDGLRPESDAGLFSLVTSSGPGGAHAIAGFIGVAWANETHDLGTERGDLSFMEYGEAVFEELHDEGYTLEQILSLGFTIGMALWEQSQIRGEVREKALFFLQTRAGKNSKPSTQASDTSEIPTA